MVSFLMRPCSEYSIAHTLVQMANFDTVIIPTVGNDFDDDYPASRLGAGYVYEEEPEIPREHRRGY